MVCKPKAGLLRGGRRQSPKFGLGLSELFPQAVHTESRHSVLPKGPDSKSSSSWPPGDSTLLPSIEDAPGNDCPYAGEPSRVRHRKIRVQV